MQRLDSAAGQGNRVERPPSVWRPPPGEPVATCRRYDRQFVRESGKPLQQVGRGEVRRRLVRAYGKGNESRPPTPSWHSASRASPGERFSGSGCEPIDATRGRCDEVDGNLVHSQDRAARDQASRREILSQSSAASIGTWPRNRDAGRRAGPLGLDIGSAWRLHFSSDQ